MAIIWRVDLYNRARIKVGEVDDYTSASIEQVVNSPGGFSLPLHFGSDKVALFEDYGIVEFWRKDSSIGLPWYREKACLIYDKHITQDEKGYEQYVSTGFGLLAMLDRTIDYPAGSPQTQYSGPGDSVMCQYVRDNAGDLATIANGRRANAVIPALNIAPSAALGGAWSGSRASKKLLDVLQEIADKTNVDFDIEPYHNPATDAYEFIFRTYPGQRGVNRSANGIVPATGLNSAGNAPVIFSPQLGNMKFPEYHFSHSGEINRVAVLGPGEKATRAYNIVESILFMGDGLDIHEATRDARNEPDSAARVVIGETILAQRIAQESFDFEAIQLEGCSYGLLLPPLVNGGQFYHFGDRVTARAYNIERTKRIIGVKLAVSFNSEGPVEVITPKLLDVPM